MRRRGLGLSVLLLALAPAWSTAAARDDGAWNGRQSAKEVASAVEEYLDAPESRRAEIRTFLDELGTLQERDARTWTKRILKLLRKRSPTLPRKSGEVFTYGGLSGVVHTGGRPKRRGALFVALHGGGKGNGDGKTAHRKWSFVQSKAFVLAPTAPELRDSAWNHEDVERWVLALIDAAIHTHGLDPNRVYLAGHSMGGYGTWSIGCRHADRFAALGACAGGIFVVRGKPPRLAPGHVPNLLNTPIWFYNSTDDAQVRPESSQVANKELEALKAAGCPYEWVYEEYDDIGHGLPPKGLKPIVDWMLAKERNPYPTRVVWEPSRPSKRRFAWLEVERDVRVEGRIVENAVNLVTDGSPGAVTVYMNDELVEVDKRVLVVLNGKTVLDGVVPARLSVLLDTIATGRDPKCYFDRSVTVP